MITIKSYIPTSFDLIDEAKQIHMAGNKPSIYAEEKERDIYEFFLKPSNIISYLSFIIGDKQKITLLDLGCGNGSNSRIIVKMLRESIYYKGHIHIIYADIFSTLLEEANRRSIKAYENDTKVSWDCIRVDFSNTEAFARFAEEYKSTVDMSYSIKFLHNTPIKITNDFSNNLYKISSNMSFFVCQYYIETNTKKKVVNYIKKIFKKSYGNAIGLDVFTTSHKMKNAGFKLMQTNNQKTCKNHPFASHFQRHSIEKFFLKISNRKIN